MAQEVRLRRHRLEGPRPARVRELPVLSAAALLLALAAAAGAAESRYVRPVALHPLLLGDPGVGHNPVAQALQRHAQTLREAAVAGYVPEAQAGYLLAVAAGQNPTEHAAALIAARLAADKRSAEAFLAPRPALADGPVGHLPYLVLPDHPYRGTVGAPDTALGALSLAAVNDAATAWLFDGSVPPTRFEDVRMPKNARKGEITSRKHPYIEGVDLLVAPKGQAYPSLGRRREIVRRLAEAGAGPRVLASGSIHQGEALAVEHVAGHTVRDHILAGTFGPAELELVRRLFRRLAKARIGVEPLDPADIVLGRTASNPELRAYVLTPGELVDLSNLDEDKAYELIEWQPAFAGLKFAEPHELLGRTEIQYQPLGRLLQSQVRDPGTKLLQRVLKKIGL